MKVGIDNSVYVPSWDELNELEQELFCENLMLDEYASSLSITEIQEKLRQSIKEARLTAERVKRAVAKFRMRMLNLAYEHNIFNVKPYLNWVNHTYARYAARINSWWLEGILKIALYFKELHTVFLLIQLHLDSTLKAKRDLWRKINAELESLNYRFIIFKAHTNTNAKGAELWLQAYA